MYKTNNLEETTFINCIYLLRFFVHNFRNEIGIDCWTVNKKETLLKYYQFINSDVIYIVKVGNSIYRKVMLSNPEASLFLLSKRALIPILVLRIVPL